MNRDRSRAGDTLVEVMIASAVMLILVLSLFEGLIVCARISRQNSERLAADAYAFDYLWRCFNMDYDKLKGLTGTFASAIPAEDLPELSKAGWPEPLVYTRIKAVPAGRSIEVDVTWGPDDHRVWLSSAAETAPNPSPYMVVRSVLARGKTTK